MFQGIKFERERVLYLKMLGFLKIFFLTNRVDVSSEFAARLAKLARMLDSLDNGGSNLRSKRQVFQEVLVFFLQITNY